MPAAAVTNWTDLSGNANNFNTLIKQRRGDFIHQQRHSQRPAEPSLSTPGSALMNTSYHQFQQRHHQHLHRQQIYKTTGAALGNIGPMSGTDGVNDDYNSTDNFDFNYQNNNPPTPVFERNSGTANYGNYDPGIAYHDLEGIASGSGIGNFIYINGGGAVNNQTYTGNFGVNHLSIGCRLNGAAGQLPYNGDIAEVLVYNTALSTANRQAVETYLSNKWMTATFSMVPSNAVTVAFNVAAPAPVHLVYSNAPVSTVAGAALGGAGGVIVQMLDANGSPATNSAGTNITVSLASGTGTLTGTLTQPTTANGQATFTNISITTVGTFTLSAAATGLGAVTNSAFTISPAVARPPGFRGAADRLAVGL